jgi:LAO/AO transport system kinase
MSATSNISAADVKSGNRSALARAITLVESSKAEHRQLAENLISEILPASGNSIRVAISGPPGVGKSSFIEAFGLHLIAQGKKIAVLAVDPSSPVTGGSILGDKTRMEELSRAEHCFIRPSPSSGSLGGVARNTREAIFLCEAAGFNFILVETVGIGQSEVIAASMTDVFVQLHQPMSGDELQGIKKGVMELADLVLVTKADSSSERAAEIAKADLERALSLTRQNQSRPTNVICVSAHEKKGLVEVLKEIEDLVQHHVKNNEFASKRKTQQREWFEQELSSGLLDFISSHPNFKTMKSQALSQVKQSSEHSGIAAKNLIKALLQHRS